MSWKNKIHESFEKNSQLVFANLKTGEEATLSLHAEDSEFTRVNSAKARQITSVEQAQVQLSLQTHTHLSKISFPITGDLYEDRKRCLLQLGKARNELEMLPENPYRILIPESGKSHFDGIANTPKADFFIQKIQSDASDLELIGHLASGCVVQGIANSKGAFHWHSQDSYAFDYSLFSGTPGNARAVTDSLAGQEWNEVDWKNSIDQSRRFLSQMQRPEKKLDRGDYRVYLAPAAVFEIVSMMNYWQSFSQSSFRQGNSGLRQLYMGERQFSNRFSLMDNSELKLSPRFNSLGEVFPQQISLIENGLSKGLMTSSRSAAEYKVESNGADPSENVHSLEIGRGGLKRENILKELGTGLYLANLHYCNWSDQKTARVTGMTRFACFWVKNGEIQSPIQDMRFDVSLYDTWGSELIDLTDFQQTLVNNSTYFGRKFGGYKLPGMLIQNFKFTL